MNQIDNAFFDLITTIERLSADVDSELQMLVQEGLDSPLTREEARGLLGRIVDVMRDRAAKRMDVQTTHALKDFDFSTLIRQAESLHRQLGEAPQEPATSHVLLQAHNGIQPRSVRPTPVFHERPVPVMEGFVRTRDIQLWGDNQRIDIHLNQFQQEHGRRPESEELLSIMLGEMNLPGVTEDDQFEIVGLARSIAANGVRKPPIIDLEGNLLDGNRRVTACYYILQSDEFDMEQKSRAEWIQVWQLTEHATDEDRESVIVSLNFESDHKQDWPEYVKAGKVYDQWQALLALEGRANPSPARQKQIRQEIARKFAIHNESVTRYIGMVELAREFEDYHVLERKKDQYAVKHRAERYFQYFDELKKGARNGVQAALQENISFRNLVYDLLYEGKFRNWNQIRQLRSVANNEEATSYLREARELADNDAAQEKVDAALAIAQADREVERVVSANRRVELFTKWLEGAPVKIFREGAEGSLTRENLDRLYRALELVKHYTQPTLLPPSHDHHR